MKVKTSELTGVALDYAVSKCDERSEPELLNDFATAWFTWGNAHYSTDWAHGGPIIEREKIGLFKGNPLYFPEGNENGDYYEDLWIAGKYHGQTPLIAAMRCYVASQLGDEVDIPEELNEKEPSK